MIHVAAFYHFADLPDPSIRRTELLELCAAEAIMGTILLAQEGVNGTVAGSESAIAIVLSRIRSWPGFAALEAKFSNAAEMPFGKLKVKSKREIVTMGVEGIDAATGQGEYVDPKDWDRIIADPNIILIDTRNDYEVGVGSFPGAINPATETFREFPKWFKQQSETWKLNGEQPRIAMFCTGGIRCEKATAFVKAQGFDDVLHLRGGILKYLETVPADQSSWQGDCFVFDDRVALGSGLQQGDQTRCNICGRANSPGAPCKDCIRPGRRNLELDPQ
jgi:UPF0176 protein